MTVVSDSLVGFAGVVGISAALPGVHDDRIRLG